MMSDNSKEQSIKEQNIVKYVKENLTFEACYGLTKEDFNSLRNSFNDIQPNKNKNDFPDFIYDGGFVEHFSISSSSETRKGASHKIAESRHTSLISKMAAELTPENPIFSTFIEYKEHSHKYLLSSFKRNWNNHINSLQKYNGEKTKGIFLVEYTETAALSMAENTSIDSNKVSEILDDYHLSRDKILLEWLSKFKNDIDYIVFVGSPFIEVIKLKNISDILKQFPYEYIVAANFTLRTDRGFFLGSSKEKLF